MEAGCGIPMARETFLAVKFASAKGTDCMHPPGCQPPSHKDSDWQLANYEIYPV